MDMLTELDVETYKAIENLINNGATDIPYDHATMSNLVDHDYLAHSYYPETAKHYMRLTSKGLSTPLVDISGPSDAEKDARLQELEELHAQEPNVDTTLAERGNRYGPFKGHAQITQDIKAVMQNTRNWGKMSADKRETLDMIAHKIGRVLNGDPEYKDNWHDIQGYAKLTEELCKDD